MVVHSFVPDAGRPPAALRLIEEINHRVLDDYADAILSLSRAADHLTGPPRGEVFEAMARLQAQADAHRILLPPASDDPLNLADYIGSLCEALSRMAPVGAALHITLDVDEIWLDPDRGWRLGLIVAELIRTATRDGLGRQDGHVGVRIAERFGVIDCVVCDRNRAAAAHARGRGLQRLHAIADELGATFSWRSTDAGSVMALQIPARPAST